MYICQSKLKNSIMEIQQLIIQLLDYLLLKKSEVKPLNIETLIEIGSYVGGGVLRGRFSLVKEVSQEEINGVFGVIGNFFKEHFPEDFTEKEFVIMRDKALELIQETTFDSDLKSFMINS